MKTYLVLLLSFILFNTASISAQFMAPDIGLGFLNDEKNFENKIDAVEAMFINEVFVKNMLKAQSMHGFADEDDEEKMFDNSQANDMFNGIMAHHLSKHLAEQLDLFGLDRQDSYYGE